MEGVKWLREAGKEEGVIHRTNMVLEGLRRDLRGGGVGGV